MPALVPSEIRLRIGEVRVVHLEGHSSGGYRWQAHVPPNEVVSGFVTPAAEPASGGASREELLALRGIHEGEATVEVELGRSWEVAPVERHTITVHVEPKSEARSRRAR
jgi:predicted secreted protein